VDNPWDHYHWFALKSVPSIGNVTFLRLLSHFGSPKLALQASADELSRVKGLSRAAQSSLLSHDGRFFAQTECQRLEASGAQVVDILSERYPRLLMEIADPPPYLYVRGDLRGSEPALAIVGSRRASVYGLSTTTRISRDLAARGITVVSGMARGIDTAAHWGALKAGGRSIAVLGCGVDVVYPAENAALIEAMAQDGAGHFLDVVNGHAKAAVHGGDGFAGQDQVLPGSGPRSPVYHLLDKLRS